jgi:4-amino-4-deoxy-L-arabinose transferase-like glycosyltransferase
MKKYTIALILLILPAVAPLLQKGYFPIHDDLQTMRQLQMHKCFQDGQIPCRWINDMGYGYGFPLFNYYPPLPYLIGMPFVWLGFSYIDVVKIVGILGFAVTAITMYFLGREFWGRRGGILAAVFYTYAPYHAVNFYVRAAVNEFWAAAFFPSILLGVYKLVQKNDLKWMILLALSFAGLVTSHNQMLLIFVPVMAVWTIYWWWKFKSIKSLPQLFVSGLWGIGLAAFYFLPVLFEQKYAHVETLVIGYFNYLAHFLDLRQMFFDINWGYGSSDLGPNDTMSFAVGYLHWIVPVLVLPFFVFVKKLRTYLPLVLLLFLFTAYSVFMAHSKSTPIWKIVTPLEFLQFPWRFINLAMFLFSFVAATAVLVSRKSVPVLLLMVLLFNANYFRPRDWYPNATDTEKFSGRNWYLLTTNGIFDYLPIWAAAPPADPPGGDIIIVDGVGSAETVTKKTNLHVYTVAADMPVVAQIETYYFPGWKIWVDGQEQQIDPSRDPLLGRMKVDVPVGEHEIVARFTETPLRRTANWISVIAWSLVGIIIVWRKKLPWGMSI